MSILAEQTSALDNYSSGLRYSLLEVEPIEETKIVKRFGKKFAERTRRLQPSQSFDAFVQFNTDAVLESIKIPSHLDRTALNEKIAKRRIEYFNRDPEFKVLLEEERKGSRTLVKSLEFFVRRQKIHLDKLIDANAAFFMASDLPLAIFSDLTDFDVTYLAALEAILDKVRKSFGLLNTGRAKSNIRLFESLFQKMKYVLSPIIDQIDGASFNAQALRWYIMIANAPDIDSLLELNEIRAANMDENELKRLHWEFKKESEKLRELVLKLGTDFFDEPLVQEDDIKTSFDEMAMTIVA